MSKLLPCPWCKATPSIFDHGIVGVKDEWSVYCKGEMCAVAPSTTGEFKQHAVSQWNNQTIARTRTPSDAAVRDALLSRIAYIEQKDLHNGWSGNESGPCCDACAMRDEHFNGRADALKAIVGCRNPFQLPEVCQCHLAVRQAVKNGQLSILRQVLAARTGELQ